MSKKSERVHALVNDGPCPGMSEAFDAHMGAACWTDPAYAPDASMWAAAWKAAVTAERALKTMSEQEQQAGASPVECRVRPRGLDSVRLTDSDRVRDGLEDMLTAAIGEHGYDLGFVEPGLALLVIEAAKRAEDRDEWFPRGKIGRASCRERVSSPV